MLAGFLTATPEVWNHLVTYVLPDVLPNTIWLLLGVVGLSVALGGGLAWLTVAYRFPGRQALSVALLLPLAMPTYILAFVYMSWLEYSAPLPTWWRELGWGAFPLERGRTLTILAMSFGLYPYVYLIARQAFLTQGQHMLEAAQVLGAHRWRRWWRVTLPLSLPWLAGGGLLVAMETLADYGTVAIFNYDTLTTAIFKTWFSLFSKAGAMQLACLLLLGVAGVLWLEYRLLHRRVDMGARRGPSLRAKAPSGPVQGMIALSLCGFLLLTFVGPLLQLLMWAVHQSLVAWDAEYVGLAVNTLLLGAMTAALASAVALGLTLSARRQVVSGVTAWVRVATFGYAFPGVVLGVGLYWPLTWLDNQLVALWQGLGGTASAFLRGTLAMLLLGYTVRFVAVAFKPVDSAMRRITPRHEEAARLLGAGGARLLVRLYAPLLAGGVGSGAMLVLLDVMKEIPITLLMRPFNWETLATRIFQYTVEGQWEQAAVPAATLVIAGLLPVWWLHRALWREN